MTKVNGEIQSRRAEDVHARPWAAYRRISPTRRNADGRDMDEQSVVRRIAMPGDEKKGRLVAGPATASRVPCQDRVRVRIMKES
jgi:hypothetical protein